MIVKLISELIFVIPVATYFGKGRLMLYYIPSAFLYILYVVFIGIYGNFGGYRWKRRKVKWNLNSNIMKYLALLLLVVLFISCNDNSKNTTKQNDKSEANEGAKILTDKIHKLPNE